MENQFDFSDLDVWFPDCEIMAEEEESIARLEEAEWFLTCCGSCSNFISIMAEAGLCKLNENNCICKNPKAIIDMFDDKCEKWV